MKKVFISYRRQDSIAHANMLKESLDKLLEANQYHVFLDTSEADGIPLGVKFDEYLSQQMKGSALVLVVINNQWTKIINERQDQADDFVRIELEIAFQEGIQILPVLCEGTMMPSPLDLPSSIAEIATINAAKFRMVKRDRVNDLNQIVAFIKQICHNQPKQSLEEKLAKNRHKLSPPATRESAVQNFSILPHQDSQNPLKSKEIVDQIRAKAMQKKVFYLLSLYFVWSLDFG